MSGGGAVWREGVGVLVQRGLRNRIEECEISHLGYTGVSIGWEWGYAKPSGGGGTLVRDNFIHHIGRWELADMGGVYVLGDNAGTRIERNVIAHVSPYHVYGWGVYLDEGASGVVVEDNLVHHTQGGGLHLHFGHNNSVERNVFACSGGADGDLAFSIGEPHAQLGFSRNVVLRCEPRAAAAAMTSAAVGADGSGYLLPADPAWLVWWKGEGTTPPNVSYASNVYYSTRAHEAVEATAPPWLHFVKRGVDMRRWVRGGQDAGSMWADPGFADVGRCDYRVGASGAAATVAAISAPPTGRWAGGRAPATARLRRAAGARRARAGARAARGGTARRARLVAAVADAVAGGAEMLAPTRRRRRSAQGRGRAARRARADGCRQAAAVPAARRRQRADVSARVHRRRMR